jgi:hypothetical protein
MSRRPITREQFDSVQRFPPSAAGELVAEKTGLSVSTVRNIRKAKTWDKFQERRVALKRKGSADRAMKPAPRPTPPNVTVTKGEPAKITEDQLDIEVVFDKERGHFKPIKPLTGSDATAGVQKPQGFGRTNNLDRFTPADLAPALGQITSSLRAVENRLDRYINTSNTALEEIHHGLADVTKDVAELKKYVAEKQKADEREAAKSRQRTNNPTFVDRLTRRLK